MGASPPASDHSEQSAPANEQPIVGKAWTTRCKSMDKNRIYKTLPRRVKGMNLRSYCVQDEMTSRRLPSVINLVFAQRRSAFLLGAISFHSRKGDGVSWNEKSGKAVVAARQVKVRTRRSANPQPFSRNFARLSKPYLCRWGSVLLKSGVCFL